MKKEIRLLAIAILATGTSLPCSMFTLRLRYEVTGMSNADKNVRQSS